MKKCPYCAEMIQDEAIKCRYCHSDLRVAPGAAPGPAGPPSFAPRSGDIADPAPPPAGPAHEPTVEPAVQPNHEERGPYHYPWSTPTKAAPVGPVPGFSPVPPEAAATVPAGPRVGEGALRFSHSGERYILGYGADFFGIWDRETPGGPLERFARTDDGWNQAWSRYSAMEPRSMAVPTGGTPPPDVRAGAFTPYISGRVLVNWLTGLLAGVVVAYSIVIVARAILLGTLLRARHEFVSAGEVRTAAQRVNGVSGINGFLILATVAVWCVWQFREHKNLRPLGASGLRFKPGWVVGWWFIPVANTVFPFLTMRELWQASEPRAGSSDWRMVRTPKLMALWWAAFLAGFYVLPGIAVSVAKNEPSLSQLILRQDLLIAAAGSLIIAGLLAIRLVRGIEARQSKKHERVTVWAETASAPVG